MDRRCKRAGVEIKHQTHIVEDEMMVSQENGNSECNRFLFDVERCSLNKTDELELKTTSKATE
jgi:hypothetical protein